MPKRGRFERFLAGELRQLRTRQIAEPRGWREPSSNGGHLPRPYQRGESHENRGGCSEGFGCTQAPQVPEHTGAVDGREDDKKRTTWPRKSALRQRAFVFGCLE